MAKVVVKDQATIGRCTQCGCDMVRPIEETVEQVYGDVRCDSWCPNCDRVETVEMRSHVSYIWSQKLNYAQAQIEADLVNLTRENMETEVEVFTLALEHDHVLPMDF